jgi:hypothetical protein
MKRMTVRGSPVVPPLLTSAAIVIVVFGLKYSSDVLAPTFLAATLAILFTPALWWLEKKGLPPWLALVVMVLAAPVCRNYEHALENAPRSRAHPCQARGRAGRDQSRWGYRHRCHRFSSKGKEWCEHSIPHCTGVDVRGMSRNCRLLPAPSR